MRAHMWAGRATRSIGWIAACGLLLGLSGGWGTPAGAVSLGIEQVTSIETTSSSQARGYRFRAEADLQVTGLAIYDVDGDGLGIAGSYTLRLWTDAGSPLAQATLPFGTGAPLVQGFRIAGITPVVLLAGGIYRLSADYGGGSGGQELLLKPTQIVTHAAFTLLANSGTNPATLDDFGLSGPNGSFPANQDHPTVGPNLVFTVVPEPGTGFLLALGLLTLGLRRRERSGRS